MERSEEYILLRSTNPDYTLSGKVWLPAGEPRAVVQIVHGMCEHLGRYEEFAGFLQEHG